MTSCLRSMVSLRVIVIFLFCLATLKAKGLKLTDSQIRFARLRCLQQYPRADYVNFSGTDDTHCYLQCFIYKTGLMDLKSRGLDGLKLVEFLDDRGEDADLACMDLFPLTVPLSGICSDYYRKVMEFRLHCSGLFEDTFGVKRNIKENKTPKQSKSVGETASDFVDSQEYDEDINAENSEYEDLSLLSQYKRRVECLFENLHFLDAYGRVDESELLLGYREGNADTPAAKAAIKYCSQRANAKFRPDTASNLALELQTCLRQHSRVYMQVVRLRDEKSRKF